MKRIIIPLLAAIIAVSCAGTPQESSDPFGARVAEGMQLIGSVRGDNTLLVITDASYVIQEDRTTERYIDVIGDVTGCSFSSGNFILVHRPTTYRLFAALFNKTTRMCVMVASDGSSITVSEPVSLAFATLNDDMVWAEIESTLGASDTFSITAIASQWAADAPFDFLKCAELHNHLCPGITSGYFIAKYIQKFYPLSTGESYTYISCPPWCKDDGIQMIMDITPGKKNMFVQSLSEEQEAHLTDSSVAGIMLINHDTDEDATALILSFDWDTATEISGAGALTGIQATITTLTGLIPFYSTPERLVHILKTMEIDTATAASLGQAGVNPYEVLGFVK